MKISDLYGRTFKTLRISLINTCNLACSYCVNDDLINEKSGIKNAQLDVSNFLKIIEKLNVILNLDTIRLTGGEPTLYKNILPLIKGLRNLGPKIKLTTNGFLLKNLIEKLSAGDLDSINVSLDAMDEDIFFQISRRRSLHKILEGIDTSLDKGINIKLNCVVIKGVNDTQILPLMEYASKKGIVIRFLELMKMGHINDNNFKAFFSESEILNVISSKQLITPLVRNASSTANYWQTSEGQIFGTIANESSPFCHDCNRLRLDSYGNIYGCLSNNNGLNISEYLKNENILENKLQEALGQKQSIRFVGSKLSMLEIGG